MSENTEKAPENTEKAPENTEIEKAPENTEIEKALTPAEVYSRRARSAADAMIADPIAAGKILAQLAASDGRAVARKAIRAAWLADPEVSAARKAFRGR